MTKRRRTYRALAVISLVLALVAIAFSDTVFVSEVKGQKSVVRQVATGYT